MRKLIVPGADCGKVYIGQSSSMNERNYNWYKASNANYAGKKITEAREKYGVGDDAWETVILEKLFANTKEELRQQLDERETYNIKLYNSVELGFNSSYGNGMQGTKHTESAKKKISVHHRDYQSSETKAKISNSSKGHAVSDETRAKISAGNKGKQRTNLMKSKESAQRKGVEPKAASEGLRKYVAINGHGPTLGIKQSPQARINMKAAQQKLGIKVRALFPDGHTEVFTTMLDAAKACKMNVGSVANSVKTGRTCRNGMKFQKEIGQS